MGKPLKKSQVVNNSPVAQSHTFTYLYTGDKPNAATMIGNYDIPANWPRPPLHNPPGSVPGPPVVYAPPVDPDDVAPGYRFSLPVPMREDHIFFYHTDHLGSTSYITDGEGSITQFVCYMPFGQAFVDVHTTRPEMPFKFNGKELDTETGLYYFGARYYDPMTALWYGVDPLAEKMPAWGSYVYCFNNPIRYVDPDGRFPGSPVNIMPILQAIRGIRGIMKNAFNSSKAQNKPIPESTPVMTRKERVGEVMTNLLHMSPSSIENKGADIFNIGLSKGLSTKEGVTIAETSATAVLNEQKGLGLQVSLNVCGDLLSENITVFPSNEDGQTEVIHNFRANNTNDILIPIPGAGEVNASALIRVFTGSVEFLQNYLQTRIDRTMNPQNYINVHKER